jgi:hypothetical protein
VVFEPPKRDAHMAFGALLIDRVTLVKKDGTVRENIQASVQAKMIIINDIDVPIERDDHILRKLPSNLIQDYIVTDPTCYTGHLAHWEINIARAACLRHRCKRLSTTFPVATRV